ncbi:MAG: putative ATPase/class 3 adenylate cyclase, partial [Gammaproteobacteria bacterium]
MEDKNGIQTTQIERRHLTVVECDLVGSTALAHKLDPEQLRDLILSYQDCALSWIKKLDGYFAQFAGDAIWVYFGYPTAHEDDAYRAIRAGLGIAKAVRSIKLHGESLNVRIGIASGLCVVGNLRQPLTNDERKIGEYITAIGDPPNLAARLQTIVEPGAVAVSDETRSLVGNLFEFEDIGFHELKGFTDKIRAWRAVGESGEQSRFLALRPETRTPLIGRTDELEAINGLWDEACNGNGQVVYLSGEPGIGKSRLASNIAEEMVGENYPQWWLHCSEYLQGSAFAPIISLIQVQAQFTDKDEISSRFSKLKKRFPSLENDALYLLAELLSITANQELNVAKMSPSRRRERLYEVLIGLIEETCKDQPLLFVVEDMQWIDPSTRALIHRLTLRLVNLPLLILTTSRTIDDGDRSFLELSQVHNFHIAQLKRDECFDMLIALWGEQELPISIAEKIVKQTDGVPLFIEDVIFSIHRMPDSNKGDILSDKIAVPIKLSDHLMSRIDELGESKKIAQIAAVVGREFSTVMMTALTSLSASKLAKKLQTLIDAGMVTASERNGDQFYVFRHAMIRDAAYNSLLFSHRKDLHSRIATWLTSKHPNLRNSQPETIAHHYNAAGAFDLAIDYWLAAGKLAKSRSSYAEAAIHLKNARELIPMLSPSTDRDRLELDIIMSLGVAQAGVYGISGEHTGKTYDKALQLCKALCYPPEVFPVLAGAASFNFIRGDYEKSLEIAEHSKKLATEKSNPTGNLINYRILGAVQFVTGDLNAATKNLQLAINIYEESPEFHQSFSPVYALDHKTTALCYLALAHATIGNIEIAFEFSQQSVAHSKTINMHSTNCSLCYQAALRHILSNPASEIVKNATQSLELALDEGFASWQGMSRLIRGEANIQLGHHKKGMQEIEEGVLEHGSAKAETFLPLAKSVLAKGYLATMRFENALAILNDAETLSVHTRQFWYLPEIQRLQAETLIGLKEYGSAQDYYHRA